jgi:hypothetical protein
MKQEDRRCVPTGSSPARRDESHHTEGRLGFWEGAADGNSPLDWTCHHIAGHVALMKRLQYGQETFDKIKNTKCTLIITHLRDISIAL